MAVTANQTVKKSGGSRISALVAAAVHLYQNTLGFIDTDGYASDVINSGANRIGGLVVQEVDNSAGAAGAMKVELITDEAVLLTGTGFTQATVGLDIYASDNFTVTTTSTAKTYIGQCVGYLSSTQIWVQLKKNAPTTPLASNASGTTAATFEVDSDLGKPRMKLGSQTGGTGDFALTLLPPATLTGNRSKTFQNDGAANIKDDYCFTATPNSTSGAGNQIPVGARAVDVGAVTTDANDYVELPPIASIKIGDSIVICCNAGTNFELRTPAASNTKINDVDSDGTAEYLCTDTHHIVVTKRTTTGWTAVEYTKLGAVVTAVIPDA